MPRRRINLPWKHPSRFVNGRRNPSSLEEWKLHRVDRSTQKKYPHTEPSRQNSATRRLQRFRVQSAREQVQAFVSAKRLFEDFGNVRDNPAKYFAELSPKDKKKFVAGFFDAEGTATDRLVLYNGDLGLLEEIKSFLESLGSVCYIYRFGKIWGIQIYQKESVKIFLKEMKCVKTSRLSG